MRSVHRRWLSAALPFFVLASAACNDDPTVPADPADDVVEIRLDVGLQEVRIVDGTVTGGPIVLPVGATQITATFHDANGDAVTLSADDYRLDIEIVSAAVAAFTRTGAFQGTLTGIAAGNTTADVSLFHIEEGHEDVGPWTVSVIVE